MRDLYKPLMAASAVAFLAGAALASPAAATEFDVFPSLQNDNTVDDVTVDSVSWSGSYAPQISSTVTHGQASVGVFHNVFTVGASLLNFNAYPIPGDTANYCFMTFTMDNSTGVVTPGAVRRGPTPASINCSVSLVGAGIRFRASHN